MLNKALNRRELVFYLVIIIICFFIFGLAIKDYLSIFLTIDSLKEFGRIIIFLFGYNVIIISFLIGYVFDNKIIKKSNYRYIPLCCYLLIFIYLHILYINDYIFNLYHQNSTDFDILDAYFKGLTNFFISSIYVILIPMFLIFEFLRSIILILKKTKN